MTMVSPEAWRAAGTIFRWRGHDVFTRVDGAGPPVLLVHGFPTASWDWYAVWPALAARHRLVTLDLLGFGFSAKPRGHAYRIVDQVDLIEAVVAHAGVARCRVLAHDYGVSIAQELLARDRAGRLSFGLDAMVLLNGGLFPEAHRPLRTQTLLASPVGPLIARLSGFRTFGRSLRRIWGARPLPDDELAAMWTLVTANDGVRALPALLDYLAQRQAHRKRWVGALVDSTVPRRFVNGLADPISGAHMVARYRELVPSPDVVELPDVGHYPQLEAPDAVAAATLDFFAR